MTDQPARNTSQAASLIAFIVLAAAVCALFYRHSLFATHPIGIAVQVLAVLLMIWARLTLKWRSFQPMAGPTQGGLITNGPYRFVRHPIYAAIFYFLIAGLIFHLATINIVLAVVAFAAIAVRIVSEEHLLIAQYPEYAAYAARTKRVIPFVL